jgi:hypothetical protein
MTQKSKPTKYDFKNIYSNIFTLSTLACILLMYLYGANTHIMASGPRFLVPGLIGAAIAPLVLAGMLFMLWLTIKKPRVAKPFLALGSVIALLIVALAVNETIVVLTTGHLYN